MDQPMTDLAGNLSFRVVEFHRAAGRFQRMTDEMAHYTQASLFVDRQLPPQPP